MTTLNEKPAQITISDELQLNLDEFQKQYSQGLLSEKEKLEKMVEFVEAHEKAAWGNKLAEFEEQTSQFEKARYRLGHIKRWDRIKSKLDFYVEVSQ